ncbi:MAG: hypothetical protein AAGA73_06390 [Pseudomonadota bacterium]
MNRERATIRARSIVGLYREQTIGSLPIEEVKLDLDRLGVDSAEIIGLSKRLASGRHNDPAAELLARIEQAQAVDSEIADLERLSMQRVLDQLPPDLTDSLKTSSDNLPANRASDPVESEVDETETGADSGQRLQATEEPLDAVTVSPDRRRQAVIGIGGTAFAVAASLLLIVALKPDVIDQFGWSEKSEAWFNDSRSPIEVSTENETVTPKVETALAETAETAPSLRRRSVQGLPIETVPLAAADDVGSAAGDRQGQGDGRQAPVVSARVPGEATAADQTSIRSLPSAVQQQSGLGSDIAEASINGWTTLPDNLIGVFILDAERAPASLLALESAGRDNQLGAKRGEASLRALGRNVLALIAFERAGERIEAAVIEATGPGPVDVSQGLQSFAASEAVDVEVPNQPGFELLELSRPQ